MSGWGLFTFLGEKLLGVFACQDQLARDFTQQFDDESDVVCKEARKTQLVTGTDNTAEHVRLKDSAPLKVQRYTLKGPI